MLNISQSVKDIEINDYGHRVMFNIFIAQILKNSVLLKPKFVHQFRAVYYKESNCSYDTKLSSQITQAKHHMDAWFNVLESFMGGQLQKILEIMQHSAEKNVEVIDYKKIEE